MAIGMSVGTKRDYNEALAATRSALQAQGFGVLTEIDVKATMKAKLDKDFRRYDIIGACNPPLAHRALTTELEIGLLLPCNVIVYEADGGGSVITALDPVALMGLADSPALAEVAGEARGKLQAALDSLRD